MILSLVLLTATMFNLLVAWWGYKRTRVAENLVVALLLTPLYEAMAGEEKDACHGPQ